MNATAIALARNDADVIEAFVRHHLAFVDLLVVVDNASCDGTRAILEALRQEGLPLMIVEDPALGLDESAKLTLLYRMVASVFNPELVYLLHADQFLRAPDRSTLEAELAGLPMGACAALRQLSYVPDTATAARTVLADPLSMIVDRAAAEGLDEHFTVLRRNPDDDGLLTIDGIGKPLRRGDEALPAYRANDVVLACFPVRGITQMTSKIVHDWQVHRARRAGSTALRDDFAWRPLLDQVLGGRDLSAEAIVAAALRVGRAALPNAEAGSDLIRDPVPHEYTTLRYLHLCGRSAVARIVSGQDWPGDPAPAMSLATGEAMDLAPMRDLCASLQAERAIVMASPGWAHSLGQACPTLALHVPQPDEADTPIDVLFVPDMPADFVEELSGASNPRLIKCIAFWPAQQRAAGGLAAELARWYACGWEPDMLRTLVFRALSTYGASRRAALVLSPADPERTARAEAIREALVATDDTPVAWNDPALSTILHPLQSVGLQAPPLADLPPAPVASVPRSVLILGAGRSGTSCLAGMFGADTHHHARDLYAPQVSNPKGFFEAAHINDLNESIMLMSSVAHLGAEGTRALLQGFEPHQLWLARFPDAMPARWNDTHRREIAKAVAARPLCLKDPRMSITAPAWLEQLPDALVLSIHRAPDTNAESVLRECRVATYLLDFRISAKDAFAVWRQAYRRAVALYRTGVDVLFLRYDDLFDEGRLARLEALVRAPLQRDFADHSLNRTAPALQVDDECQALNELLDALAELSFDGQRTRANTLIDRFMAAWPDQPALPGMAADIAPAAAQA